jgi:DNA-nicking Smr family endonuclease
MQDLIIPPQPTAMKKKKDLFNPAFKDLKQRIENRPQKSAKPDRLPVAADAYTEEEAHFEQAMSDVTPLTGDKIRIARTQGLNVRPAHPAPDDEKEGLARLRHLVEGSVEMDFTFSDEYMEGAVKGLHHRLLKRLKRGQVPVQDYIDLHGLSKQEAEVEVKDFILRSHRTGLRCVLIVHGRGLNSPDSFPILKENMPLWLNRGPLKRIVLAFATARPYDGGTGAVYVLLRRR